MERAWITVQAKFGGVNTSQGISIPLLQNLRHIFEALIWPPLRPPFSLLLFHFFKAYNRPLHVTPHHELSTPLHHHGYGSTSHSLSRDPLSTLRLLQPHHTSTNHTGLLHGQICIGKRLWKELIGGTHCLLHEDMHFLILLWAFVMCCSQHSSDGGHRLLLLLSFYFNKLWTTIILSLDNLIADQTESSRPKKNVKPYLAFSLRPALKFHPLFRALALEFQYKSREDWKMGSERESKPFLATPCISALKFQCTEYSIGFWGLDRAEEHPPKTLNTIQPFLASSIGSSCPINSVKPWCSHISSVSTPWFLHILYFTYHRYL